MKYIILFVLFFICIIIGMDMRDRNFISTELHCDKKYIDRQFFHYYGKDNRIYYVNGDRYMVNGLFYLELSKLTR